MNTNKTSDSESPKFKQIIDTATELFIRFGLRRVTVEEICQTAKISKMTFYKYFGNKIDLAEYIIFKILDEAQLEFDNIFNQSNSFADKINQFLKMKMGYAQRFSKEFYLDFLNLSPKIHNKILEYTERNQLEFINLIEQAQRNSEVRKDISIKFITFMQNHIFELIEDKKLFALYNNLEKLTNDMVNFYFYGIMGKK
ncbi:TetR/AcrR family transcriptional regulator [bacterium]|nr:TetR/AcrR family transcriptional regulator [bacterium]